MENTTVDLEIQTHKEFEKRKKKEVQESNFDDVSGRYHEAVKTVVFGAFDE